MVTLKKITIRNFSSIGADTQELILDKPGLSLVMGENLDLGSSGARNGVGKCLRAQTKITVNILDTKTKKKFEKFMKNR